MGAFLAIVLSLLAIFLILLILVQRGRGGGLAGALGGMGGSSAFGAKAGDVFTRITIVTASIWIVLSLFALFWANHRGDVLGTARPAAPADSALDMLPQARPDAKGGEPTAPPAETKDAAPASSAPPANNGAAPATQE
jgi:preprotein translocase subunit SecG